MKIEFENNSQITTIDTNEKPTRSKIKDFIDYYSAYPYEFAKLMGYLNNLYWYQKLWIWISYKLSKLK